MPDAPRVLEIWVTWRLKWKFKKVLHQNLDVLAQAKSANASSEIPETFKADDSDDVLSMKEVVKVVRENLDLLARVDQKEVIAVDYEVVAEEMTQGARRIS